MGVIYVVNLVSLILTALFLIYTIYEIIMKLLVRKYKAILVNKILSLVENKKSKDEIISTLTEENFPEDIVSEKYFEIKKLMNIV